MHEREGAPGHSHAHAQADEAGRPTIGFIGAGRVGTALGAAFARAGWTVSAVASRDEDRRTRFQSVVPGARGFSEAQAVMDDAELIFVTVPDDALAALASQLLLYSGQALVHTSGAQPASVLAAAQAAGTSIGSFHPLVAFTDVEQAVTDLRGATIALDGDESLLPLLAELAEDVGGRPVLLPPAGKPAYHAAAMLAAGGLVGLLDAIAEVAQAAGLDEPAALAVYLPLARQALANAERLGIEQALTGPFLRGDAGTVAAHLQVLRRSAPAALPLYLAVARRELALAERRGELAAQRAAEIRALLDAAD
jgi:predicted short-subunit dehydrogenase-like oxidoreductase (DUF2520 family)